MATIANLIVNLGLQSASFTTGINRSTSTLKKFGRDVSSFATSTQGLLTGAFAALGVGLSVHAIEGYIRGQMDAVEATSNLSERLGFSTEALTGWQHAANLADIDAETFNVAIQKMVVNLGDAATGGAKGVEAFKRLGLSAVDIGNMNPDEAFRQIAEGFKNLPGPAERAKAAIALFGKGGGPMVNMLLDGADGMRKMEQRAKKLGLSFSAIDGNKVKAANDAIKEMGAAFDGVWRTAAIQLSPFITYLSEQVIAFATDAGGMSVRVVAAFEWVMQAVAKTADAVSLLQAGFYIISGVMDVAVGSIIVGFGLVLEVIGDVMIGLDTLGEKLGFANQHWGDAVAQSAQTTKAAGERIAGVGVQDFDKAGAAYDAFTNGTNIAKTTAAFNAIKNGAASAAQAALNARPAFSGLAAGIEEIDKAKDKMEKAVEAIKRDLDTFGMSGSEKKLFDLKAMGFDPVALEAAKAELAAAQKVIGKQSNIDNAQKKVDDLSAMQDQYGQAEGYLDQLSSKEATQKMGADAQAMVDSAMTPLQKYQAELKKIGEMADEDILSQEEYLNLAGKAQDDLRGAVSKPMQKAAATEQRFAFTYKADRTMQDPVINVAKLQLEEQKKQTAANERTAKALEKNRLVVAEIDG